MKLPKIVADFLQSAREAGHDSLYVANDPNALVALSEAHKEDAELRGLADKMARVVLAIQRGGGDYLGDTSSIHRDFIDLLLLIPEEIRNA